MRTRNAGDQWPGILLLSVRLIPTGDADALPQHGGAEGMAEHTVARNRQPTKDAGSVRRLDQHRRLTAEKASKERVQKGRGRELGQASMMALEPYHRVKIQT
jgi:hypothetical protein